MARAKEHPVNIDGLRKRMIETLARFDEPIENIDEIEAFTNLCGKIIKSAEVELKAATITHSIEFLK
jgi:hypothetical protein